MQGANKKRKVIIIKNVIFKLLCEKQSDIMCHMLLNYFTYNDVIHKLSKIECVQKIIIKKNIIKRKEQNFTLKYVGQCSQPVSNLVEHIKGVTDISFACYKTAGYIINGQLYVMLNSFYCKPIKGYGYVTSVYQSNGNILFIADNGKLFKISNKKILYVNKYDNVTYCNGKLNKLVIINNYQLYNDCYSKKYNKVTRKICLKNHTVFINDCKIYVSGINKNGILGLRDKIITHPTQIKGFNNIICACSATYHTMFVDDNKLYGMGDNHFGRLGLLQSVEVVYKPIQIKGFNNVTYVACRDTFTVFINDGKLYGMGRCSYSMLCGTNKCVHNIYTPRRIGTFKDVVKIKVEYSNILIITG